MSQKGRGAPILRVVSLVVLVTSVVITPGGSSHTVLAATLPQSPINSAVSVPDHPQPLSYDPTSIKDLKAADPGTGINLVQPPQANNMGDARVSYPIELPPGRNGMQPTLAIAYSSSAGNGWLGLGWDMAVPTISVDTRWGVPRYDGTHETETYLLNGQQLTPVANRGEPQPRTSEKVFHARVEGQFQKIIRHGDGPRHYWWEVIDKNGTRSFFGGDPTTGGPTEDSTLGDSSGDTFQWALREVRDLNGNGVKYAYVKASDAGVSGGTVPGLQLYLKTINYTQTNGTPGPYTVTFFRDSELPGYTRRPDVIMNARGGFLMVTANLLKRVDVSFNNSLVRSYDFDYEQGAFGKSLLKSITQRGETGAIFATHEFSYYDDVATGNGTYQGFGTAASWQTGNDNVTAGLLNYGQATALSGSISNSFGGHLYLGFNPDAPTKEGSAGAKVGFNTSSSDGVLALIDINGDGLPDKVFKSGDGFAFRLNQSGPRGTTVFGPAHPLPTLPAISQEASTTLSAGAEAYFGVNGLVNHADTFTTGSIYFSDVNGDGLPDLVDNGAVLFNHLDASGVPTFSADSSSSPVPIGSGAVDTSGIIQNYESVYQKAIDTYPLVDTLRRWVAPYDGQIRITGDVHLIQDTSGERRSYKTADGARVAIQHNGDELWSATIGPDDYSSKTPTGVESISVKAGDRIYFRVQSVFDGKYDQVAWDPQIDYLGVPQVADANGLNPYHYRASKDFVLAGRRGIQVRMPLNGTVRVTGDLHKLGVTTDDVTLLVLKNGTSVFNQTLGWDKTGDIPLSQDISVSKGDSIQLRVQVDSPIDLHQIQWDPRLFYTGSPDVKGSVTDDKGNYLFQLHPPYDVDMYPVTDLTSPQEVWTAPQTGALTVTPQISTAGSDTSTNGTVTLTIKGRGRLVAKRTITITKGQVDAPSFTLNVNQGDTLYFDYSAYDPQIVSALTSRSVAVTYGDPSDAVTVPSAFHSTDPFPSKDSPSLYAQAYRGWTYVGYNGNRDRASKPIDESLLVFNKDDYPQSDAKPGKATAYPFNPFPDTGVWRGPDDLEWVGADKMSSSRLGVPSIAVPRAGDFAGVRAVVRLSHTEQTALGLGASLLSGSLSTGSSSGEVDYLDMNGDGFPDIVGNGHIQYTTPTGALEGSNQQVSGLGQVRDSKDTSGNLSVGGSPAMFKANERGEVDTRSAPRENNTGSQMVSLGLSGSLGNGDSSVTSDLVDVNGDGLPDRVSTDGNGHLAVAFNLGYSFTSPEAWGDAAINDGSSTNFSIGPTLGFNSGIYDYAGGASLSKNESQTTKTLLDVNGDGLPDRVIEQADGLHVAFNTGAGFGPEVLWGGASGQAIASSGNTGLGGGAYFTIPVPLCYAACYLIINPGGDASQNMARQEVTLRDVNGDGYPDAISSSDDDSLSVAPNLTGRTNLLKSITRPLGATIDLEYQRDGNTYDQPQSRWVLSKVSTLDGHPGDGVDTQVTTYRYENGFYNRLEREFYGYRRVTAEQRDHSNGDALYRSIIREYLNDSYYTKGQLRREVTDDAAGHPYLETENTYVLRDVVTGNELTDPQSTTATVFPELSRTDQRFYEGNPTPGKTTFTTYQYDGLGNLTQYFDSGDVGPQDDVTATIDYSSCPNTYVVGTTIKIVVTGNGVEMRHREASMDCATGNVTQVRQYLANGDAATTDLAYFPNGNLQSVKDPPNQSGDRYQTNYEYDPMAQAHITKITNSFGYTSTATYNLKYGTVETTTDENNNQTTYSYDEFGRTQAVFGPYEQGGSTPTIQFEYHPEASTPWALTRHIDSFRSATDTIDTVLFVDGLKRVIQTKKDATVFAGPDSVPQDVMIVSGRVTFDFVGRTVEQYYPVTEPLGTPGTFNATYDNIQPTRTAYDILDRTTKTTIPDATSQTTAYGFGPDRSGTTEFQTTVTDANGNQKKTFQDVRQLVTSVEQFHASSGGTPQPIWTSYSYDPLQQLVEVRDDKNNVTKVSYDSLGRRTSVDNPDAGKTESVYDLASNVVAKISANLRAKGKQIAYGYDFNRLKSITYPDFPENNVTYTYGDPGASDNRAGRITRVTDESGTDERFYGKLGEITKEIKTVASATHPASYTTQYVYDTWGRLQTLTYPDGETLTYRYDSGGQARQVTGQNGGSAYNYVNRLEYDKFEQRAFMEAGNGVRTQYSYRPDNRRLQTLQAGKAGGSLFQNLSYAYDNVGNILSEANNVPIPPASQYGGPTTQKYSYDDLYRLTGASGTYQFMPNKTRQYSLSMTYDTIDNILSKQQSDQIVEPSGKATPQKDTTYSSTYAYAGSQPHAPTHFGDKTFTYDANGNQLGWTDDRNGTRRTISWDEENRIQSISDNGHQMTYKYDDSGQRVVKRGPQGETVYVNSYFTVRNGQITTKNVFVGTDRIVSKLNSPPVLYFYQPDHLGSSNYVTDANGQLYEHLEYFPFGETWVDEKSNTQRAPYLFTGKELDEETGLYYYGARYYDPRTSAWQSPDPLLTSDPARGIDAPSFYSVYVYAKNNPLIYRDTTGLDPESAINACNLACNGHTATSALAAPDLSTEKGRFDSLQQSMVFQRDELQSSERNNVIDKYYALQESTPESYGPEPEHDLYAQLLSRSIAAGNYSRAARSTPDNPIYNRTRWFLQAQLLPYQLTFGGVSEKVANSTEFTYQLHEHAFMDASGVETIGRIPWWILTWLPVPGYLIDKSIQWTNSPTGQMPVAGQWIRTAFDYYSEKLHFH